MIWSFYYAGPKSPTADPNCVTCLASMQKRCPAHGTQTTDGCAHCAAVKGGPCHAHWGAKAALDYFTTHPHSEDAKADFVEIRKIIDAHLAKIPDDKSVVVDAYSTDGIEPEGAREIHVVVSTKVRGGSLR